MIRYALLALLALLAIAQQIYMQDCAARRNFFEREYQSLHKECTGTADPWFRQELQPDLKRRDGQ